MGGREEERNGGEESFPGSGAPTALVHEFFLFVSNLFLNPSSLDSWYGLCVFRQTAGQGTAGGFVSWIKLWVPVASWSPSALGCSSPASG